MKSVRLYQNTTLKVGMKIDLDESATHHLIKVLRFPEGKNITLFNGDSFDYLVKVINTKKTCSAQVLSCEKNNRESSLNLTLAQAIAKGEKMDFLIQKPLSLVSIELFLCKPSVVWYAITALSLLNAHRALAKNRQSCL